MEEFTIWLVSLFEGIDGLTLLIILLLMFALFYAAKAESPRRDSRRRNQAHRIR